MASERVRMARALDAVEKVVERCCDAAVGQVVGSSHVQIELKYDILGAVNDAAAIYGADYDALLREAWPMLRNGLDRVLRCVSEVRYVKPYERDGRIVGVQAKVFRWDGISIETRVKDVEEESWGTTWSC